ncbi:MAG: ABC transporter ATP-binding protein [Campylobacteraceae bacterium]|nr:ABC transporter ATP-binding protein [Campylobacteraceae bacterium]
MLELKNIEYEILREKIVKDFSLVVKGGEVITLFGPSGCGKTTILRLISEIVTPKSGEILNDFKRTIYLFQENRLLDNLTALENVLLTMPNPDTSEVLANFKMLGLSKKDAEKYPYELSGGMAKRVAFIRAILAKPNLLLLDEPFVGLDEDLKRVFIEILRKKIEHENLAIILVTHDRFESLLLSNKVLFLSPKLMQIDKILELKKPIKERDNAYITKNIEENFKGIIYYD